jgi:hypothetical protein
VEDGTHPRGNTDVIVPGIDFEAAADIFDNANIACLTPDSGFAAARVCTVDIHAGDNTDSVNLAWDAVGVQEPEPPIALTDGRTFQTLSEHHGSFRTSQQYTRNVPAGYFVECVISANDGDADLYLRFGNPESLRECVSANGGSNEVCSATAPVGDDTTLFADVHANDYYSYLEITCTISSSQPPTVSPTSAPTDGLPIALTDGQTLGDQNDSFRRSQQYTLDVPAGYIVECVISANNGDADLYLRFGDPESSAECYRANGGSNEVCSATAPAGEDTALFAEVVAWNTYSDLEITCTISWSRPPTLSPTPAPTVGPPIALTDGQILGDQHGSFGTRQQYTLNVSAEYFVECVTSCNNGDADLHLRFGTPESAPECECDSASVGSNEVCSATAPAGEDTALFAEVVAWNTYSDLEITCTTTKPEWKCLFNRQCKF